MTEVASLLLGLLLGLIPPWFLRKRRLQAHWWALRAELTQCFERAETLLRDNVEAPLYRLPTTAFTVSFPIILADCAIDENEALTLSRCFSQIQDINRGLDNAASLYMANDHAKLRDEYNRNCMKAKELITGSDKAEPLMASASRILDQKISLPWWKLTKLA